MGCSGCGSGSILPGSLTARKRAVQRGSKPRKVKGYASNGVIKSQTRKLRESGLLDHVTEVMKEASEIPDFVKTSDTSD